ncbi:site-specific integrase [Desulfovibrio sp. OttesenSCG-928-G11]|nr:site-specific integrase [Desulfovibrio sp. OttesenSCG-928-G11]
MARLVKPLTATQVANAKAKSVFPLIGKMPIREMKAPDFLEMLRRLESQKQLYSVKRISIVCGLIMRFAVATGRADADPMPSLRGSLKAHKTKHLASTTDPKQVGRLLRTIDAYQGSFVVSCALKIAPYVFVRPGELQHARWEEIDFEACEWRYTTSKTNTPHIVPLAPQVMKILKDLHDLTGHQEWVFPSMRQRGEPMGKTTILAALRAMGITDEEMTPHGFRAMARTLLDEVLGERYDHIEHQLAHMVRDPNGRAYNRTVHLVERKRMMERWANYLDELRADVAVIA